MTSRETDDSPANVETNAETGEQYWSCPDCWWAGRQAIADIGDETVSVHCPKCDAELDSMPKYDDPNQ